MEASAVAPKMPVHVASASAASREKDNYVVHIGFRGPVEISIASSRPRIPPIPWWGVQCPPLGPSSSRWLFRRGTSYTKWAGGSVRQGQFASRGQARFRGQSRLDSGDGRAAKP